MRRDFYFDRKGGEKLKFNLTFNIDSREIRCNNL